MTFARVRALIVVGVLFVAAVVFVVMALVKDTQGHAVASDQCPAGAVKANLKLPEPKDVKIRVVNGTNNDGWAEEISSEFKNREFQVQKPGDNNKVVNKVAIIRFGPNAVGAAHLMQAYFLGNAQNDFQIKRKTDVVDIIIGTAFKQLATSTEVNQSLVELGEPSAPPGTCPADAAQ
jgi:hypothetical protein